MYKRKKKGTLFLVLFAILILAGGAFFGFKISNDIKIRDAVKNSREANNQLVVETEKFSVSIKKFTDTDPTTLDKKEVLNSLNSSLSLIEDKVNKLKDSINGLSFDETKNFKNSLQIYSDDFSNFIVLARDFSGKLQAVIDGTGSTTDVLDSFSKISDLSKKIDVSEKVVADEYNKLSNIYKN